MDENLRASGDRDCETLRRQIERVDGETYTEELMRLEAALALLERSRDALTSVLGGRLGLVRQSLIALRDSFWIRSELERRRLEGHDPAHFLRVRAGEPRVSPPEVLGDILARRHPGEVLSIWLLFDRGRHFPHPMDPSPAPEVPSDPDRIEHLLARAGPAYLLPLHDRDPRSALLDEPADHWTGGAAHSCVLRKQADAVFFVREVQPPRRRG